MKGVLRTDATPPVVVTGPSELELSAGGSEVAGELERHWAAAYRLALGMRLDHHEAQDAAQEAALLAWRRRAGWDRGRPFGPWFLAIVANRCRERYRSRWWRVARVPVVPEAATGDAPHDALGDVALRSALRSLAPRLRLALVLRYYLDMPVSEVARVSGCSIDAAESRIRRALARLRPLITPLEDAP
jgi:RNA polymerase sigma factor (sigma-70 family)